MWRGGSAVHSEILRDVIDGVLTVPVFTGLTVNYVQSAVRLRQSTISAILWSTSRRNFLYLTFRPTVTVCYPVRP